MILGEAAGKLAGVVDIPWCRGDEHYIQKLALVLGVGRVRWEQANAAVPAGY